VLKRTGSILGAVALGLALVMTGGAQADDVQALIDKYIEATGGAEAHKAVNNRVMKGTFSIIDMGIAASMESYSEPPNYLSVVAVEGMGEVKSGISDGTVWEMHFMNGDSILEGDRAAGVRQQAALNPWANWKEYFSGAEVVGDDELDGEAVTKVAFSREGGEPTTVMFSKDSGLIVGQEAVGPDGLPALQIIGDYKEVGGVKVAHKMEMQGAMTIEIVFSEVEQNTDIPEGTFALPEPIAAMK